MNSNCRKICANELQLLEDSKNRMDLMENHKRKRRDDTFYGKMRAKILPSYFWSWKKKV